MGIVFLIQEAVNEAIRNVYGADVPLESIIVNETKAEFTGDYTLVTFSLTKILKKNPDQIARQIGEHVTLNRPGMISGFNVIKGFLNFIVADRWLNEFLTGTYNREGFGQAAPNGKRVMVEYSSPNTNKPLHLGHLRNNFLGWSIAEIFKRSGYTVIKSSIANDRGIHICKSMVAWLRFGHDATPGSTGIKGDHFVGDYYVKFGDQHKKEIAELMTEGRTEEQAAQEAPIMKEAQQMLVDWEAGRPDVIALWKKMNRWVYEGWEVTYRTIGSDFDKHYYESQVYLLGKKMVEEGLRKGVFFTKEDGSVWIDLTPDGLDEKIVRRRDGTAVYITQDIGLVELKYEEFAPAQSVYVVGNEQDYHFKVLRLIAQKMGINGAEGIHHLSYGMVELPSGKMKTREGTVVDADDIVAEMKSIAAAHTRELGKVNDFEPSELEQLYSAIGLGALKFFLLRVEPRKKMLFNPEESIDFHGFTGPFIQYTYARTRSILRKESPSGGSFEWTELLPQEKKLLLDLERYPPAIEAAAQEMNPSVVAGYLFKLAQQFNSFLTGLSVLKAETLEKKELRLRIANFVALTLRSGMGLLGIGVPERM